MRTFRRLSLAALTIVLTAAISACSFGLQDIPIVDSGTDTVPVVIELSTADGLVDGADVRLGQQIVGRVQRLSAAADGGADVHTDLDSSIDLPANLSARVELPTALGAAFIRLTPPESPQGRLVDTRVITRDHTSVGPQIDQTLATIGTVINGSGLDQITTIITNLNQAFAGRSDSVHELTATLNRLLDKAIDKQPAFDRAMRATVEVTELLANQQRTLDEFLRQVPGVVSLLSDQRDQLVTLMDRTADLSATVHTLLNGRTGTLTTLQADANRVLGRMTELNGTIGGSLKSVTGFLTQFSRSVRGDYLLFTGTVDIPGGIDKLITGGLLLNGKAPTIKDLRAMMSGGQR